MRLKRDYRLETREARTKLQQRRPPYWRSIHQGLAIGYRKGIKGGVWMVRRLTDDAEQEYAFKIIGNADDHADANGLDVLNYRQAHETALELSKTLMHREGGPYTVGEATADYLAWLKTHKKSGREAETTINAHILPRFKDRQIASLRTAELERWQHDLVTAPLRRRGKKKDGPKLVAVPDDPESIRKRKSSANRIWTIFRAALTRAWDQKKVGDIAQWKRVKPFKDVDEARKIFLQPDQCQRLINVTHGAFRSYVQTLLYTGARPGKELEHIRTRDFDRDAGTLHLQHGKTGPRDVFLNDEGINFFTRLTAGREPDALLLTREDGSPWTKSSYIRLMRAALTAAKLPSGTSLYTLRHTYISLALKNGMNVNVLADSCGTSLRMIERHYAKFLHADRRAMFNALPSFGFKGDNVKVIR